MRGSPDITPPCSRWGNWGPEEVVAGLSSLASAWQRRRLISPKTHSSCLLRSQYFLSDMEFLLCLIIKLSLIIKEAIFNLEPIPSWEISGRQMCPDVVRWYLFSFQWSQRFSLRCKQAKKCTLLPLPEFIVNCFKLPLSPWHFIILPTAL
jgi:hypothetical protein